MRGPEQYIGSGFFYNLAPDDAEEYIVIATNYHVIEGHDEVEVCWWVAQQCATGEVLYTGSENFDVAIVDVGYESFNLGKNTEDWLWDIALVPWEGWGEDWGMGDVVYAAGYPSDETRWSNRIPDPVVTEGVAYHGDVASYIGGDYIQHGARLFGGNSGGPLMNSSGWIIGMNTASDTTAERVELAIPLNWINHWTETGEEPDDWQEQYETLTTADGGLYAVLTWTEDGEPGWRYQDDDGNSCVTLVYPKQDDTYEWKYPICRISGYDEDDGEVYFKHQGEWYIAPQIPLSEQPEWG